VNSSIIYGATGFTGQLVSERAKRAGLDFIVASREARRSLSGLRRRL